MNFKRDCTLNEVKKLLYKEKPSAILSEIREGIAYYSAHISTRSESDELIEIIVDFKVPVSDMGNASFRVSMESQHLLRWLDTFRNVF